MEMDAVGTITQILSVIDRMTTLMSQSVPILQNPLNRKSTLVANEQPGSSSTRISLRYPTAQNFRIILRSFCIVKECPAL